MSVDVHWLEGQHRILYFRYHSAWTWDHYYHALNHAETLMLRDGAPLAVLHDFVHSSAFPASRPNHIDQYAWALLENRVCHIAIGGGELWAALRGLLIRSQPALDALLASAANIDEALDAAQNL